MYLISYSKASAMLESREYSIDDILPLHAGGLGDLRYKKEKSRKCEVFLKDSAVNFHEPKGDYP